MNYINFHSTIHDELDNIDNYIEYLKLSKEIILVSGELNNSKYISKVELVRQYKARFEYKSILISLYGLIEKTIEDFFTLHIGFININTKIYRTLSSSFQEQYPLASLNLLKIIYENRTTKYNYLQVHDGLDNLTSCIQNKKRYKLNSEAFISQAGSNYKHQKINELFNKSEIKITENIQKNKRFKKYIQEKKLQRDYFKIINNLVDRRNIIAHGAEEADLLNLDDLKNYAEYLRYYLFALYETILSAELAKTIQQYKEIGLIDVYNGKIIAFSIKNYKIKKGDYIIVKHEDIYYRFEIIELEKDHIQYDELQIRRTLTNISVKIDSNFRLRNTIHFKYFILIKP
ncbi:HEPN domain-containing protein [Sulfurospirillum diekertiae]|uniref:RiboL-PSP-HEPN domain-containing protein n=1 Tax=Sulfurospirillum diekertiae TaxID=1854492 RepID=A0AA92FEF2_9BACT|nr:HEPN domain-containing protein [Sulfurospirillum diekertiae]QIR74748.1 hypothetical protein FA584_00340 [Sulfurospirillum diekertiae]